MKNIVKLIILFFLSQIAVFGESLIRYETNSGLSDLSNKMTLEVIKNATSSGIDFNTGGSTPICQEIYRAEYSKNDQLSSKKQIETEKVLIDFNYKDGTFTCLYKNTEEFGEDQQKVIVYSLKDYAFAMGVISGSKSIASTNNLSIPVEIGEIYNLFGGKYKPSNIEKINGYENYASYFDKLFGSGTLDSSSMKYDLYDRASELGLLIPSGNELTASKINENFTVSQFVTGLITLNSDVVKGVDAQGNIKISSDIEAKMAILQDKATWGQKISNMSDKISDFFSGSSNVSNAKAVKGYTSADSFTRYFDKKIFGLYYNFMNIGWGAVFTYGGMLALGLMFLYSGSIIGWRFAMFKADNNNKDKEFEFPFKNRLYAIAFVFGTSFLSFPTGESTTIKSGSGQAEQMQLQTSIAKYMIGYLANIGATIADVASNSATVVYMDYLFKATNTQSYDDIVQNLNSNRRTLVEQAVLQSFFKDNCVQPYQTNYTKFGSFQGATSDEDARWGNVTSFSTAGLFFPNSTGIISPLLCKKLEANLVINRQYLENSKKTTEKMIDNLEKTITGGQSNTTLAQVYVDTQLVGAKSIGWFQASTLPVSHVFMLNSNIINNAYDGFNRATKGEAVTTSLVNKTNDMYSANGENNLSEALYDKEPTSGMGNAVFRFGTMLFSYQIYNMMPHFPDMLSSIQKYVSGATDRAIELSSSIFPPSKLANMSKFLDYANSALERVNTQKDKSVRNEFLQTGKDSTQELFIYIASFAIAVYLYKLMMSAIFAGVITLLSILKISLYFWDVFMHYFVSPLIVAWKMTIQDKTEKVNAWVVDGFVIYVFKPTLIVFSFFMFIISFEILLAIYGLIFDVMMSSLNMASSLFEDSSLSISFIVQSTLEGFADIFIYVIGMIMAYFIILKGDTMILDKFRYKDESDSGMVHQLGNRIKDLAGAKLI